MKIQYYTYVDEYKTKISQEKAEEEIKVIFSKYPKELILKFISSLLSDIDRDLDYSPNTLLKIHKKYLGIDNVNNIIHRRAIHLLSQIFYSFDNYSWCDSSTALSVIDTFRVFLFSNTILDIVEGQDFTSDLKIFYNSYKSSSDYINNFDLHNIFFLYTIL